MALVLVFALFAASFSAPVKAAESFHNLIQRQFESYDPDYQIHRKHYGERLEELSKAIADAQANGRNLHCSQQMFLEANLDYSRCAVKGSVSVD